MTTRTTVRSWPAMGLAGVFLAGTSFVLFNDILFDGARPTTGHVLTALALIAATAAGHQIVTMIRARRIGVALGMVVLTTAALAYVATMSGARNAEQTALKAERIEAANAQREEFRDQRSAMIPERQRSQAMLEQAQRAIAEECKTGKGARCEGRKATAEVYANAVAGIDAKLAAIDARLEDLGGPQTPNAGNKAAAEAIVFLPWFHDRKQADVEKALIVLLPWLAVLIAELGTIVFLSSALGHRQVPSLPDSRQTSFVGGDITRAQRSLVGNDPDSEPPNPGGRRRRPARLPANVVLLRGKEAVQHPVISALERAGKPLTNVALAEAMQVCGGESTKRRREVAHLLDERPVGKYVLVGLKAWRTAATA